jgi:hypothetical protein
MTVEKDKKYQGEKDTAPEQQPKEGEQVGGQAPESNEETASMVIAKIREKFPDDEFESDEQALDLVLGKLNELEDWQGREMKANEVIRKSFEQQPELGELVKMISQGAGLREALPRVMDPSELIPAEGDPDLEAWEQNRKARMEQAEAEEATLAEMDNNIAETEANLQAYAEEQGMEEADAEDFAEFMVSVAQEIGSGKISKETMDLLKKGRKYDDDLAAQSKAAEIKGKNSQVEEAKKKKQSGDGLPNVQGQGGGVQKKKTVKSDPFGEAVSQTLERRKF